MSILTKMNVFSLFVLYFSNHVARLNLNKRQQERAQSILFICF